MPQPPKNLTTVDKNKYNLEKYVEGGQIKEHLKEEAYKKYYSIKFQRMQEKKALSIY